MNEYGDTLLFKSRKKVKFILAHDLKSRLCKYGHPSANVLQRHVKIYLIVEDIRNACDFPKTTMIISHLIA
jgi:hypothetical protein